MSVENTVFYVYVHERATDGVVFYVGKGKLNRAWSDFCRNKLWIAVVAEHGFKVTILRKWMTDEDACALEKQLIREFLKDGCPLVNLTAGGIGGLGHRKTKKQKLSIKDRVTKQHQDPEFKVRHAKAIRDAMLAKEVREKVSIGVRESYKNNPERALRNVQRLQELHAQPEMKERTLRKNRERTCKPFLCVETGVTYIAQGDAAEWLKSLGNPKAHQVAISRVLTGKAKSAYGFHWRFLTEQ